MAAREAEVRQLEAEWKSSVYEVERRCAERCVPCCRDQTQRSQPCHVQYTSSGQVKGRDR